MCRTVITKHRASPYCPAGCAPKPTYKLVKCVYATEYATTDWEQLSGDNEKIYTALQAYDRARRHDDSKYQEMLLNWQANARKLQDKDAMYAAHVIETRKRPFWKKEPWICGKHTEALAHDTRAIKPKPAQSQSDRGSKHTTPQADRQTGTSPSVNGGAVRGGSFQRGSFPRGSSVTRGPRGGSSGGGRPPSLPTDGKSSINAAILAGQLAHRQNALAAGGSCGSHGSRGSQRGRGSGRGGRGRGSY